MESKKRVTNVIRATKEQLAKSLLTAEKKIDRLKMPTINKHEMNSKTWVCKWCKADHPAAHMPCVDRYEDGTLVKDVK